MTRPRPRHLPYKAASLERRFGQSLDLLLDRWRGDGLTLDQQARLAHVCLTTIQQWKSWYGIPTSKHEVAHRSPNHQALLAKLDGQTEREYLLRHRQEPYRQLARRLGVHPLTIWRWRHRYGVCGCPASRPHRPYLWPKPLPPAQRPWPRTA